MACLHPQNSISNVVVSLTIHDDTYMYTYTFFEKYVNVYVYENVDVYVCPDLKDGERGLGRANAGGGSWRY